MNASLARNVLFGTVAVVLAAGVAPGAAAGPASPSPSSHSSAAYTPDKCTLRNGGDWNACNVGNSGRGDRPYLPVHLTPNDCILRNGGDWNACNVGNSGRADRPYLPVR